MTTPMREQGWYARMFLAHFIPMFHVEHGHRSLVTEIKIHDIKAIAR